MRTLGLALLIAAAAFGQPAVAPRKPYVAGRVLKQNGDPMRHATVTLLGPERLTATADTNGSFRFEDVPPGKYALIAQRVGYASQKYGAAAPLGRDCSGMDDPSFRFSDAIGGSDAVAALRACIEHAPGTTIAVSPGLAMGNLVIRIAQLGVISGKVTNQDSEAISGQVAALIRDPGAKTLRLKSATAVEPDGGYTLDALAPGRYYLLARDTSAGLQMFLTRQSKSTADADVATYYPSELEASKAVPVEVKAGEEVTGMDILLRRTRVFSVRGKVAIPEGVAGAFMVTLTPAEGVTDIYSSNRAVTGADGVFEILNVVPGAYLLSCRTAALYGQREVMVSSGDVEGANLTLGPGVTVAGAARVEGVTSKTWPTVRLVAGDGSNATGLARFSPDGSFSFAGLLPPAEYAVHVESLPPGTYVKSIRSGSQDALHGPLNLSGGGSANLEIVLSPNAGAIAGKAATAAGDAAPGALVTAWPATPEAAGGVQSASTDQNGQFEIEGLGPGDYFVATWEDLPSGLANDASFLGRFQSAAAKVGLEEGGRAHAEVELITRERIDSEIAKLP